MSRALEQLARARLGTQYGDTFPERALRLRLGALRLDRDTRPIITGGSGFPEVLRW